MFLTLCSPPILKGKGHLVAHLVSHDPTDTDATWLGQGFQPRRDIHPVAEDVVLLGNYVAEIDADAILDPLLGRGARVALDHPALDLNGTPDGVHYAGKLGQEPVAGVLYDPASVLGDLRIDQFAEVGLEPFVRPLLIRAHQPRIPRHVGGQDRGEAADRGHFLPSARAA
jgi:hypothetical protein